MEKVSEMSKMIEMIDSSMDWVRRLGEQASDAENADETLLMHHIEHGYIAMKHEMSYPPGDRNTFKVRQGIAHAMGALLLLGESLED